MALYRVCYDVAPLRLSFDGSETRCGFVKNLYVWGTSESEAIVAARNDLDAALARNSKLAKIDLSDATFKVDEVERSGQFWKLFRPEGFVFYKIPSIE